MISHTRYHRFLRVSALVLTLVVLFDGGFITPISEQLSNSTIDYLGANVTGVFATIEPNEINQLTAQLTERQRELDLREAALSEREIAARDFNIENETDYSTYILSAILFLLTLLIMFNYVLDWVRLKNGRPVEQVQ